MNGPDECAGISDILPEFLAGRVSEDDDRRIRAHLETCTECRSRANAVSLLQQTPVPQPDPDRWDHFVDGVVEQADHQNRWLNKRAIWILAAALAAATIAVLMLATL